MGLAVAGGCDPGCDPGMKLIGIRVGSFCS